MAIFRGSPPFFVTRSFSGEIEDTGGILHMFKARKSVRTPRVISYGGTNKPVVQFT